LTRPPYDAAPAIVQSASPQSHSAVMASQKTLAIPFQVRFLYLSGARLQDLVASPASERAGPLSQSSVSLRLRQNNKNQQKTQKLQKTKQNKNEGKTRTPSNLESPNLINRILRRTINPPIIQVPAIHLDWCSPPNILRSVTLHGHLELDVIGA
jgi:hypothetical protein